MRAAQSREKESLPAPFPLSHVAAAHTCETPRWGHPSGRNGSGEPRARRGERSAGVNRSHGGARTSTRHATRGEDAIRSLTRLSVDDDDEDGVKDICCSGERGNMHHHRRTLPNGGRSVDGRQELSSELS
jgi:hypothetical protein